MDKNRSQLEHGLDLDKWMEISAPPTSLKI